MARKVEMTTEIGELTEEGKKLWDNIAKYEELLAEKKLSQRPEIKLNPFEVELLYIRRELKRMIKNSQIVIAECDDIISIYKTQKEYLASDAKVARELHQRLISRLTRVLEGKTAFDHEIVVDDDGPGNLYRDTFKNQNSS